MPTLRASVFRGFRPLSGHPLLLLGVAFALLVTGPGQALAETAQGSLTGQLTSTRLETFQLSTARIPDLGVGVDVADDGTFRLDNLRPGAHLLEIRVPGLGSIAERVEILAGEETSVEIALEEGMHSEEIVVTASALARSSLELAGATTSLSGLELDMRRESTLGETLINEPGVTSTFYGPGASQPVIRGQTGRRVRTLEGGIGTGDASAVSADHALTTEPFQAQRIEILRGPGTLLYGSSAIGGVVNVIDERVPTVRGYGFHGDVELLAGTGNDEQQGSVQLGGGGDSWAWNFAATAREADDYDIPGFARSEEGEHDEDHDEDGEEHEEHEEHEEENPFGTVPNSDIETDSARIGATYFFGDRGFIGASVSRYDSLYGLPGEHEHGEHGEEEHEEGEHEEGEHEEGEHEEEEVRLDMQQRRLDVRGQINQPFNGFEALRLRVGATDYEHVEQEGDEIGTTFSNELFETRLELVQARRGRHSGSVGVQFLTDDLEAVGAEAFIPATETSQFAIFTLQELEVGPVTWKLGARYEEQDADPVNQASQSHDGLSGSLGLVWQVTPTFSLAASGARSVRLPAAEELFSDGLHVATRVFEVGDPTLTEEV
ncbi:MAG: TonB-dependent receptor, partial [Acidobacteriota bacterium]